MSTTAVLPIGKVVYPAVEVEITYEDEHIIDERGNLRLFRFTASKNCILYFTNPEDFGIQYLILQPNQTETLTHSDEEVNIEFQVFARIDEMPHLIDPTKGSSDPPPINP